MPYKNCDPLTFRKTVHTLTGHMVPPLMYFFLFGMLFDEKNLVPKKIHNKIPEKKTLVWQTRACVVHKLYIYVWQKKNITREVHYATDSRNKI